MLTDLQALDIYERIREWMLRHRPVTERELRELRAARAPDSREERRLRILGGFLGIDPATAGERRLLLRLARQMEKAIELDKAREQAADGAEDSGPENLGRDVQATGSHKQDAQANGSLGQVVQATGSLDESNSVREDQAQWEKRLSPRKRRREIERLWNWDDERGVHTSGTNSAVASATSTVSSASPAALVRGLCGSAPFLRGLVPYRILQALGEDVIAPDAPRQRVLARLGFLEQAPSPRPESLLAAFEAMARIASLAGEPVRVAGQMLGLFSGALWEEPEAEAVSLCRSEPRCGECPVQSLCAFRRLNAAPPRGRKTGGIRALREADRPRERLARNGAESLGDAELLAILLRTGHAEQSALDLAAAIMRRFETLERLDQAPLADLETVKGIGPAKAVEIKAALELGKRLLRAPLEPGRRMTSSREVFEALRPALVGQRREQFQLLALNNKNEIIRLITVSVGNLTQSLVHPREVFREAIREAAAAVILIHNHPSGDPAPSQEDFLITDRLREAGELLGIQVLDHLVIGRDTYYSFADEGRLENPGRQRALGTKRRASFSQ